MISMNMIMMMIMGQGHMRGPDKHCKIRPWLWLWLWSISSYSYNDQHEYDHDYEQPSQSSWLAHFEKRKQNPAIGVLESYLLWYYRFWLILLIFWFIVSLILLACSNRTKCKNCSRREAAKTVMTSFTFTSSSPSSSPSSSSSSSSYFSFAVLPVMCK